MNIRPVSTRTVSVVAASMFRLQDLGEEILADILIQSKHSKLMCICKAFHAILRNDKRNCQEFQAKRTCSFGEIYNNIRNMRPIENAVFLNLENLQPMKCSITTEAVYLAGILRKFQNIRQISFCNCSLSFCGLTVLTSATSCQNLEKLVLRRCDLKQTHQGLLALLLEFNASTLKEIDFSCNPNLELSHRKGTGLALQKCTNLQSLNLTFNNIWQQVGVENILQHLNCLKKLSLIASYWYSNMKILFQNLNKLTKLENLKCLGSSQVNDHNGFLDFTLLPCSLVSLQVQWQFEQSFDNGFLTAQVEGFRKLTDLKTLNLSENRFVSELLQNFMADASIFKGLTSLNFSKNGLTNDGVIFLANTFSQLTSLHDLDLSSNLFRERGGLELVKNMHNCPSFRTLTLNKNLLSCKSVERMLEQSLLCTSLVSLSVVRNPLGNSAENDLKTTMVKLFRQGLRKDFELLF